MTGKKKKSKIRRRLIVAGCIMAGVTLLCMVFFAGMLLDAKRRFEPPTLSDEHFSEGVKVINRVLSHVMSSRDNNDVKSLVLSESEVNAVINLARNSKNFAALIMGAKPSEDPENKDYMVEYKDGKFEVFYCVNTEVWTPFGSKVNLSVTAVPHISLDSEKIDVLKASAGNFALPEGWTEEKLNEFLLKQKSNEAFQLARQIIVRTEVDDTGHFVVYYHPFKLRSMIVSSLMR